MLGAIEELKEALDQAEELEGDVIRTEELPCPYRIWDGAVNLIGEWACASEAARNGALLVACMGAADLLQAHLDGMAEKPVAQARPGSRSQSQQAGRVA
jgi:hypothetical protein